MTNRCKYKVSIIDTKLMQLIASNHNQLHRRLLFLMQSYYSIVNGNIYSVHKSRSKAWSLNSLIQAMKQSTKMKNIFFIRASALARFQDDSV